MVAFTSTITVAPSSAVIAVVTVASEVTVTIVLSPEAERVSTVPSMVFSAALVVTVVACAPVAKHLLCRLL